MTHMCLLFLVIFLRYFFSQKPLFQTFISDDCSTAL